MTRATDGEDRSISTNCSADTAPQVPANEMLSDAPTPTDAAGETPSERARRWRRIAASYAVPSLRRSILQLIITLAAFAAIWAGMVAVAEYSYWATLPLAVPAAAFLIRLFLIQHDCGHHSFFKSRRLNDIVGSVIGLLTLTPHGYWRKAHNIHHATSGNLDKRGIGDISILTVREYLALSWWKRLGYRCYRHPLVFLGIGPLYVFVVKYRLPLDLLSKHRDMIPGVLATNLAIGLIVAGLGWWLGFADVLMVHAPIITLSTMAGVWLFYVQHQFEDTYWRQTKDWSFHEAAIHGSSFYDLPQPLRWLTADIGIHHIHHLSSRIPNYRLAECLADHDEMRDVGRLTLWQSLSCLRLALWDEDAERLIGFRSLRQLAPAAG
ncbi:putative transmembrane fatty acid desaturase [alpha proteobacterium BAL199]|nr:putative transmembrane fatty acid desaturase [alpha proteobacterium BAL199]